MIIIDEKKYYELLCLQSTNRAQEDDIQLMVKATINGFQNEVYKKLGIQLKEDQVQIDTGPELHGSLWGIRGTFKVNKNSITFLDEPDKVIRMANKFSPPIRVEFQCSGEGVLHNREATYYPWGYDLERNMQVWKRK